MSQCGTFALTTEDKLLDRCREIITDLKKQPPSEDVMKMIAICEDSMTNLIEFRQQQTSQQDSQQDKKLLPVNDERHHWYCECNQCGELTGCDR